MLQWCADVWCNSVETGSALLLVLCSALQWCGVLQGCGEM